MQPVSEWTRPGARAPAHIGHGHEEEPLRGYLIVTALFATATAIGLLQLRKRRGKISRPDALDVLVLSGGTLRLSRLVSRDKVMSPVRAPFTDVEQDGPDGEAHEHARGSGAVRAIGELLTCPQCTAMWASAVLFMTYSWAPDIGRSLGLILTSAAISDLGNRAFAKLG